MHEKDRVNALSGGCFIPTILKFLMEVIIMPVSMPYRAAVSFLPLLLTRPINTAFHACLLTIIIRIF